MVINILESFVNFYGLMLPQVLLIGVTTGNSVFGLFRAVVFPYPRGKEFVYMLCILILVSPTI